MYLKATKATRKSSITCAARDPARNLLLQPHIVFGRSFTRSSKPQGPSEVTETTKSNKGDINILPLFSLLHNIPLEADELTG